MRSLFNRLPSYTPLYLSLLIPLAFFVLDFGQSTILAKQEMKGLTEGSGNFILTAKVLLIIFSITMVLCLIQLHMLLITISIANGVS